MKKLLIIFFSVVYLASFKSQNWNVFNKNYRYNYKYDTSSLITNVLFVTSTVQAGTDTIYNLNLIGAPCQSGCPTVTAQVGGPTYTATNNQIIKPFMPQFLQRQIRKYGNGLVMLRDTGKFVIKPNCSLNQTWLFDSLTSMTATCVSIGTKTIFGTADSIKTLIVGVNDTLVLSKSFGIIQFPKTYNLNKYYRMAGIENSSSYDVNALYGIKVPNFWDFYNYNIGDMYYVWQEYCNQYAFFGYGSQQIFQITGKQASATGYTYQTMGWNSSHGGYNCPMYPNNISSVTQEVFTYSVSDPANLLYPGAIVSNNTVLTQSVSLVGMNAFNICKFKKDINNRFSKQAGIYSYYISLVNQVDSFAALYKVNNSIYLSPVGPITQGIQTLIYTEDIGTVNSKNDWNEHQDEFGTRSAVIGGDTLYGHMPNLGVLLAIKENSQENSPGYIYPNPADKRLKFRMQVPFEAEVYDTSGRILLANKIKESEELDISDLPEGVYFMRIRTGNSILNQKFIISR